MSESLVVPAGAFPAKPSVLDGSLTREEVLERVDSERLVSGGYNQLVLTALSLVGEGTGELAEDMLLRYSTALSEKSTAEQAYIQLLSEKVTLTDLEYQAAISAYTKAEAEIPSPSDWALPQHYIDVAKIHERRMDRLLRARTDAFKRFEAACALYREALAPASRAQGTTIIQSADKVQVVSR